MKRKLISVFIIFAVFTAAISYDSDRGAKTSLNEAQNSMKSSIDPYPGQSNFARLADIAAEKVTKTYLTVAGEVIATEKASRGLFTLSIDKNSTNYYVTYFDTNYNKMWSYKFNTSVAQIKLITDEYVLIRTHQGLAAIDYNGKAAWSGEKFKESFRDTTYFSDNVSGIFVLGQDDSTNEHACTLYHISNKGEVLSCKPYDKAGKISPIQIFNGKNDDYWLYGASDTGSDIRFLVHLDSELNVVKKFELKENQYPKITFLPENNSIVLYGQAYKDNFAKEYGFIYEIDWNCSQKAYETYDKVPRSVSLIKDGRWVVSFSNRENLMKNIVKIFNAGWSEDKSMDLQYAFTELFTTVNGGFVITGQRLSPGQTYGSLFVSSVRAKMDTVYEKYSSEGNIICRETYFSEKSKGGNGYTSLVADNGNHLLFQ